MHKHRFPVPLAALASGLWLTMAVSSASFAGVFDDFDDVVEERPARSQAEAEEVGEETSISEIEARLERMKRRASDLQEEMEEYNELTRKEDEKEEAKRGRLSGSIYATVRPRLTYYQDDYEDLINPGLGSGDSKSTNVTDFDSGLGIRSEVIITEKSRGFLHAEWDFNLGENASLGNSRVAYAGAKTPLGNVAIGKQTEPYKLLLGKPVGVFNNRENPYGFGYVDVPDEIGNLMTYDLAVGPFSVYVGMQYDGDRVNEDDRRADGYRFNGSNIGPKEYVDTRIIGLRLDMGKFYMALAFRQDEPANYVGSSSDYLESSVEAGLAASGLPGQGALVTNTLVIDGSTVSATSERQGYDRSWQGMAVGMVMADWLRFGAAFQQSKIQVDDAVQVDVVTGTTCGAGFAKLNNLTGFGGADQGDDVASLVRRINAATNFNTTHSLCAVGRKGEYAQTAWDAALTFGRPGSTQLKVGYFTYDDDGSSGTAVSGYNATVERWISEQFMVVAEYFYQDLSEVLRPGQEQDSMQSLSVGFRYDFNIGL